MKVGTITPKQFLRGKWICPECKEDTWDYPAISRKDNTTKICSDCGVKEALKEFGKWKTKKSKRN